MQSSDANQYLTENRCRSVTRHYLQRDATAQVFLPTSNKNARLKNSHHPHSIQPRK